MKRMLTKKLTMAERALEFLRAHPFTDRNQAAVSTHFAAVLEQAQALLLDEQRDRLAAAAAKRHGADLRRELEADLLPGMERIGAFALRGDARQASRFASPPRSKAEAAFVARATNLLAAARAHQETLTRSGLPRAQVTELADGLAQFRDTMSQARVLRQQHHDTRTKLERALTELSEQLHFLDALNRVRFKRDAALLDRWTALRTVGSAPASRAKGDGGSASESPAAPGANAPADAPVTPADPGPADPGAHDEPPQQRRPTAAA